MLKPGDTADIHMTNEEKQIMENCGYVEIYDLHRSKSRRNKKEDAPASAEDVSGQDNETSVTPVE
ncbi:hypothetical protein [uncultured Paraglaciecola sp.]|uniref:hypothetical protein n=1 Tax=uncultured Paraglaciecola sp. TaxID=1765024 RepID=UPI002606AC7B|nr:hypothetical protein [uncultured Paraglaciecola sp.]